MLETPSGTLLLISTGKRSFRKVLLAASTLKGRFQQADMGIRVEGREGGAQGHRRFRNAEGFGVCPGTKDPVDKARLNENGPQQKGRAGGSKNRSSQVRQGTEINTLRPSGRREARRRTADGSGVQTRFFEAHGLR